MLMPGDADVPEWFRSLEVDEKTAIWNQIVEAYVQALRGGGVESKPVPMPAPGGYGTIAQHARERLCANYLKEYSAVDRARIQLQLLYPLDDRRNDSWITKEFRLSWAMFVERDLVDTGIEKLKFCGVTGLLGVDDCWMLGLAVCFSLGAAPLESIDWSEYRRIANRFLDNPTAAACLMPDVGYTADCGAREHWRFANDQWCEPGRLNESLARLMLHIFCSRLYISPRHVDGALMRKLRQWLEAAAARPRSRQAPELEEYCSAKDGPHHLLADVVAKALAGFDLFGGAAPLDPGAQWPDCFRPYKRQALYFRSPLLAQVEPPHAQALSSAYALGVLAADAVLDIHQAVSRDSLGVGFGTHEYKNLYDRLESSRRVSSPPPQRCLLIARFAKELARGTKVGVEERILGTIERVRRSAPHSRGAKRCAMCGPVPVVGA